MTLRRIISRGIYDLSIEDDVANAIGNLEGWGPSTRHRRVRLMQALSDGDRRKFDAEWVLVCVRFFAFHGRDDLCKAIAGSVSEAIYEGRREADTDELKGERRGPHRVRHEPSRRRESA